MENLHRIVRDYVQAHGSSENWVSEQMGLSRQGLNAWWNRGMASMPAPFLLHKLAMTTRVPYRDVLDAALEDFGYLPESLAAQAEPTAKMNRKGKSVGRQKAQAQDADATAGQDEGPEFGA